MIFCVLLAILAVGLLMGLSNDNSHRLSYCDLGEDSFCFQLRASGLFIRNKVSVNFLASTLSQRFYLLLYLSYHL